MSKFILKADGKKEEFNKNKITSSLIKAGASNDIANATSNHAERYLNKFQNTNDIYIHNLKFLNKHDRISAIKFTLKKALMNLGPEGFIFEKYIAKILNNYGYTTEIDNIVKGFCVEHEVDIIADKDNERFMIECKYHNTLGINSDIKVALYVNSRFLDIQKACLNKTNNQKLFTKPWLITNTRCTEDAIKYGNCADLKITAWSYPETENLQYLIENKKLYPVTILPQVNKQLKTKLFNKNIITIVDLSEYNFNELSNILKINKNLAKKILQDAKQLLY